MDTVLNPKFSRKSLLNQDLSPVRNTKEVRALIQNSDLEDESMKAIFEKHKFDGLKVMLNTSQQKLLVPELSQDHLKTNSPKMSNSSSQEKKLIKIESNAIIKEATLTRIYSNAHPIKPRVPSPRQKKSFITKTKNRKTKRVRVPILKTDNTPPRSPKMNDN